MIKFNYQEAEKILINKLRNVSNSEVILSEDDVPLILNLIKMLEIYELGNFYGVISIKFVGKSTRNLRIQEQTFKLKSEKSRLFLDS